MFFFPGISHCSAPPQYSVYSIQESPVACHKYKYISHIRGGKLAVDLCNQSTATKGNLEGIFGVVSYWGEKRSTANIEIFVFKSSDTTIKLL
jgi:hypothetical protein